MKTGIEIPLVFLAFALGLVILWSTWSGYQVDIAAAQVQATAVGGEMTAPAMLGAEMVVKAIIGLVLGGVVTAGIGYGVAWVRSRYGLRPTRPAGWRGGPNARWQRAQQPPVERGPSEAQVYRAMLMQQYRANGNGGQARPDWAYQQEAEDEPVLRV